MARTDPQFNLRMPEELKRMIDEAARESRRSANAEIVGRLAQSFNWEPAEEDAPKSRQIDLMEQMLTQLQEINEKLGK